MHGGYYNCRSTMIIRGDLELRWQLLMCENEFRTNLYCYYNY